MGTYFGYVKREADSYINWAEVGNSIVKDIDAEIKIRSDKKAAYEKNQSEIYNFVKNNPMGENTSANEGSLQLANDAQNYLLQLNKLVKSNKMSVNEYMIRSQNLKDDTTHQYGILKSFQERAKAVSERAQKNESQPLETQVFEELEGFGNFTTSYSYIDPATGHLWRAEKEKRIVDGKEVYTIPDKPTGKLQQMQTLAQTMQVNYNRFDSQGTLKKIVDSYGKEIRVVEDAAAKVGMPGRISEVLDMKNREGLRPEVSSVIEGFEKAETLVIETQLANPFNTTSILMGEMKPEGGGQYTKTYDPEEAKQDSSKILLKIVNNKIQPDFESTENGKKQYKAVVENMRTRMRLMYDHIEKPTITPALPDVELARKKQEQDYEMARRAANTADYNAQTARMGVTTAAAKAETEAKKQAKKDAEEEPTNGKVIDKAALNKKIDELKLKDLISPNKPQTTKKNIMEALKIISPNLGFEVKGDWSGFGNDYIIIKSPANKLGEPLKFEINNKDNVGDLESFLRNPDNYIIDNMPEELLTKEAELN
jgi:hypothetical protein